MALVWFGFPRAGLAQANLCFSLASPLRFVNLGKPQFYLAENGFQLSHAFSSFFSSSFSHKLALVLKQVHHVVDTNTEDKIWAQEIVVCEQKTKKHVSFSENQESSFFSVGRFHYKYSDIRNS